MFLILPNNNDIFPVSPNNNNLTYCTSVLLKNNDLTNCISVIPKTIINIWKVHCIPVVHGDTHWVSILAVPLGCLTLRYFDIDDGTAFSQISIVKGVVCKHSCQHGDKMSGSAGSVVVVWAGYVFLNVLTYYCMYVYACMYLCII